MSINQQRTAERATSKQAVYDNAVQTVSSLNRMTRAYANAANQGTDSTIKNSFNKLFQQTSTPSANTAGATTMPSTSTADKVTSGAM